MRTTEVAVIGGGIIGCSVAYHLTRAGVTDVVLFERGALAGGATGVCPGGIRQQFEGDADCRFAQHSVRFYERINEALEPDDPLYFERSGYLFLAESEAVLDRYRCNVALQNRLGIPSRILDPAAIRDLLPALMIDGIVGGSYCAEDGFIEDCHGVTNLFALRARQQGARVMREEVVGLTPTGRAWTLTTSAGAIEAQYVVLAAGADSVPLAAEAGVTLPIVPERRRLVYTEPCAPGVLPPLVIAFERHVAGKQMTNGVFYLGWLEETADVDDLTFIEHTMSAGATLLPVLSELGVRHVMGGIYDNTPDRRPLLGCAGDAEGLILAVGFSGHGFMIAPAVGEAIAAAITGRATNLPIADFSLDRFSGTASREGLQI